MWLKRYSDGVAQSRSAQPQTHPIGVREVTWTLILVSIFVVLRAILNLPSLAVAKWYVSQLGSGAQVLVGQPQVTGDIAGNVAQARALLDPSFQAYDQLEAIFPLIGVVWDVQHGHPRLPMEIPLFVPFAMIDHASPIYQLFAFALTALAVLALAWSLRLMDVPPLAAWSITVVFVVTPIGASTLESSYPFVALGLAASWSFRNRPLASAIGLVVAGAGRGLALLPALYFVMAKSWRTLVWLVAALTSLLLVAVFLETTVVTDFLGRGLEWGRINAARPDNASLSAALVRPIYAYLAALVIFLLAVSRPQFLYWGLAWLSAALAPIAWTYAAVALFPLGAFIWNKGIVPRASVVIAAVVLVANGSYAGLTYAVVVLVLGVGLVAAKRISIPDRYASNEESTYLPPRR